MNTHTPEPWSCNGEVIHQDYGHYKAYLGVMRGRETMAPTNEANAERIVACVNACAGITNNILLNPELKKNDLFFQCLEAENKVERFTLENNELIIENEKLYKMLLDLTFHAAKRDNTNDPGNVMTFRHDLAESVKKAQDLISETAKSKRTKKYRCNKCNGTFNTPKLIHDNEDYEHCPHCESDDFDLLPKKI